MVVVMVELPFLAGLRLSIKGCGCLQGFQLRTRACRQCGEYGAQKKDF